MRQKDTIQLLEKIADKYKKEYHLSTRIDISKLGNYCYYNCKGDYIALALRYVQFRIGDNLRDYIFALLHELKHAIDYTKSKESFEEEARWIDWAKYQESLEYHNSVPFEKRANDFAEKEVNLWL